MAKSSRSSRIKKNNQILKKKVFAPVSDARNERLHAKLLELAKAAKDEKMDVEKEDVNEPEKPEKDTEQDIAMENDDTAPAKPQRSKREVKRLQAARAAKSEKNSRRKPRNQVAFPSHPMKKKSGKR